MPKLLFIEPPQIEIEKQKKPSKARVKKSAIVVVGLLTLGFLGAAITLYAMKQPEAGRLVIDIAIAFLS